MKELRTSAAVAVAVSRVWRRVPLRSWRRGGRKGAPGIPRELALHRATVPGARRLGGLSVLRRRPCRSGCGGSQGADTAVSSQGRLSCVDLAQLGHLVALRGAASDRRDQVPELACVGWYQSRRRANPLPVLTQVMACLSSLPSNSCYDGLAVFFWAPSQGLSGKPRRTPSTSAHRSWRASASTLSCRMSSFVNRFHDVHSEHEPGEGQAGVKGVADSGHPEATAPWRLRALLRYAVCVTNQPPRQDGHPPAALVVGSFAEARCIYPCLQ
eukprot:GHVU01117684.1.p1 GENE.GHVU01117684.1~~GHVU01117684.1.p1  ORF type:complete len:270 (-),score=3.74 GHVU01117684.1:102-911(-)